MPKTQPVGDELQSTALQSADDDDDDEGSFKPNFNITQKASYFSHEMKNNNCPLPSLIGKSKSVQGHNNSSSESKVML